MTTTMSDLPKDLVVEILTRVPITSLGSVRATCKQWNDLSRNQIFGKVAEEKNQFLGFMMKGFRISSVRMDVQGIHNGDDFIDLSIKHVNVLNDQVEVCKVYRCDGLLLCTLSDTSRLLVWNPYLGQTRWIQHLFDKWDGFSLGYDNSGNHKILQILGPYDIGLYRKSIIELKIYEFNSNSWKEFEVTPWKGLNSPVTLKGNVYFIAEEDITVERIVKREQFLSCFDFTSERFGPRLSLPFFGYHIFDTVILSLVRDKQLAVLRQRWNSSRRLEIWVTNKIDYNNVLWTKWIEVDMCSFIHRAFPLTLNGSFFIDEENKVGVVFYQTKESFETDFYQKALIFGQDIKFINVQAALFDTLKDNLMLSPYVPSLVEI